MRNKKKIIADYAFFDRSGIQEFLEDQARKGWLLTEVAGATWKFQKCEPLELHYAVAYFPADSNGKISGEKQDFLDLCGHSGWELVCSRGPAHIFKNEGIDPVPIETDAALEIETIHRAVKKHFLGNCIAWMILGLLHAGLGLYSFITMPYKYLARPYEISRFLYGLFYFLWYGHLVVMYYGWRRKAKLAANTDGSFVKTRSYPYFNVIMPFSILFTILFGVVADQNVDSLWVFLLAFVSCLAIAWISKILNSKLDPNMDPKKAGRRLWVQLIAVILLGCFACGVGIFPFILILADTEPDPTVRVYISNGDTYQLPTDSIPLTIEDMTDIDGEIYSYEIIGETESFLIGFLEARQYPCVEGETYPDLGYRIVRVRVPWLYDHCENTLLDNVDDYVAVDAAPWGAERAYFGTKPDSDEPIRWLLCYEDRIVELRVDWELTPEQMATVGEILGTN